MSDPFREFVEQMARLLVPEDDTEKSQERREAAASRVGDADQRARQLRHHRLRGRRVPVLGGAGALGDDPQGAGAGRIDPPSMALVEAAKNKLTHSSPAVAPRSPSRTRRSPAPRGCMQQAAISTPQEGRLLPGSGNDFTISGATITMLNGSFLAGTILADYCR